MTAHVLTRPLGSYEAVATATSVQMPHQARRTGPHKPPVRRRPQLLSLLLSAYLVFGCGCTLVHLLAR